MLDIFLKENISNETEKELKKACEYIKDNNIPFIRVIFSCIEKTVDLLKGSSVNICALVGFPFGKSEIESKCIEAKESIKRGASEIEYILNKDLVLENNIEYIEKEIISIKNVCDCRITIACYGDSLSNDVKNRINDICTKNKVIFTIYYKNNELEIIKSENINSFKNKIIAIDMTTLFVYEIKQDKAISQIYGRQLAFELFKRNSEKKIDTTIIASGFLGGTGISSTAQVSIASYSKAVRSIRIPVIKGDFAEKFSLLGLKALVILNSNKEKVILKLTDKNINFLKAKEFKNLRTSEAFLKIKDKFGNCGILYSSIASDKYSTISTLISNDIQGNPTMKLSRGYGFGANFIEHGIKAIIISDFPFKASDISQSFSKLSIHYKKYLEDNTITGRSLPKFSDSVFFKHLLDKEWLILDDKTKEKAYKCWKELFQSEIHFNVSCCKFCNINCIACFKNKDNIIISIDLKTFVLYIKAGYIEPEKIINACIVSTELGICNSEFSAILSFCKNKEELKYLWNDPLNLFKIVSDNKWLSKIILSGRSTLAKLYNESEYLVNNNEVWPWFSENNITDNISSCLSPYGYDEVHFLVLLDILNNNVNDFSKSVDNSKEKLLLAIIMEQAGLCENILLAFNRADIYEVILSFIKKIYNISVTKNNMLKNVRDFLLIEGKFIETNYNEVFPKKLPDNFNSKELTINKLKKIRF